MGLIRSCMKEWDKEGRYIVRGQYSKSDKAVIFDLHQATVYCGRKKRKAGGEEPEGDGAGVEFDDPEEVLEEA